MCEDCTRKREEIKRDLRDMLDGEDNRLSEAVDRNLPAVLESVNQRIDAAIESGQIPEDRRPDEDEVREAVRDTLVAAVLATGAASLAASTPGYTDEGGISPAIILGQWAGAIMSNEIDQMLADSMMGMLKQHLGMGDN